MKYPATLFVAAAAVAFAGAASAHDVTVDRNTMDQRFQQMGRMMDQLPQMQGPARHDAIHEHMQLMRRQMDAMHGMRGGHGGPMFGRGTADSPQPQSDLAQRMDSMEQRMEAMQRMMEQMLRQQELLLEDETG